MRKSRFLVAMTLVAALLSPTMLAHAEETSSPTTVAVVGLGVGEIPAGKTGELVKVLVPLVNRGDADAPNVLVSPKPSADPANFPFEITKTDYTVEAGDLVAGGSLEVPLGEFQLRSGLATGYYALPLTIQYGAGAINVIERTIFVHVEGVDEPDPGTPPPVTTDPPPCIEVPVDKGGNYVPLGGGDLGDGGGSATSGGSIPRVMLTSFTTDPAEVYAGQNFLLHFSLSNMSTRTAVGNIKVTVASPDASFLPVGGASSMFISVIYAGQSAGGEMHFRALPTLEERPYLLSLSIEYEDLSNYQSLTTEETIAVVVRQRARAETSTITVMPEMLNVGQDANISFNLQNQGKARLFNTKVRVKAGQAVSGGEQFIGNIEPGAVGAVDMMVRADKTSTKPIILEISYEDAAGAVTTFEREVSLEISEASDDKDFVPIEPDQGGGGFGILPLVLGAALLIGAGVGGYLVLKKRKQRQEEELAASLEHLDAEPIVPVDPQ